MIFGRPQGQGSGWTRLFRPAVGVGHQLCRRVSAEENFGRFSYTPELPTPSYPTSVWVLSNEIESWNLLIFSLTFPSRFWLAALAVPSGRDSPASGALLLGDGEKRQR